MDKRKVVKEKAIVSDKLDKFLDLYIENGGDNQKAWIDAGYSESSKQQSMRTLRDNWQEVERRIKMKIGSHVPLALAGVIALAQNAKTESVRLKALQDILKRAGYDAADKFEFTEKRADELDDQELKAELTELLKRSRAAEQTETTH